MATKWTFLKNEKCIYRKVKMEFEKRRKQIIPELKYGVYTCNRKLNNSFENIPNNFTTVMDPNKWKYRRTETGNYKNLKKKKLENK